MKKVLSTLKDLQESNAIATITVDKQIMKKLLVNITMEIMLALSCLCGYMSRFINYMPELSGKIAIAPAPVFEEGQDRSVGGGGTGTVVTNQCE